MNKLFITTALIALLPATAAFAGAAVVSPSKNTGHPTFMLGIDVEFGDPSGGPDVGITGKVLSTNLSDSIVVGAGASYFPLSSDKPFGIDLDLGVNLTNVALMGGYDFIRQKPQVSVGYVPTEDGGLYCPPGYTLTTLGLDECYNNLSASDRRLKRDIVHLATLSDGIRLYSFRYLWSDVVHVGVMAQDLLEMPRWRHAVITGRDGYYLVDYDKLDLTMVTLEAWEEHGLDAMVLGSRPAEFLAADAA